MPTTSTTTRLEIDTEFASGDTYSFSVANPRFSQDDHVTAEDITALESWMLTNQPLAKDGSAFTRIRTATIVQTTKTSLYEAEDGLWAKDQAANAWRDNYS